MPMVFYPYEDDVQKGSIEERLLVLLESAERFRTTVIDSLMMDESYRHPVIPRDIPFAFNWNEIAALLREVRTLSESSRPEKMRKSRLLLKLSEVYEVLRAAKLPKLEAVRLALVGESNQLGGNVASGEVA